MGRYLVVAHQTAESPELLQALRDIADDDAAAQFELVVPATHVEHVAGWTEGEAATVAADRAAAAQRRFEEAGVHVVAARPGDARPYEATLDALNDGEYDRIVISTFAPGASRWLGMNVVQRLERNVALPVTHVIAG